MRREKENVSVEQLAKSQPRWIDGWLKSSDRSKKGLEKFRAGSNRQTAKEVLA